MRILLLRKRPVLCMSVVIFVFTTHPFIPVTFSADTSIEAQETSDLFKEAGDCSEIIANCKDECAIQYMLEPPKSMNDCRIEEWDCSSSAYFEARHNGVDILGKRPVGREGIDWEFISPPDSHCGRDYAICKSGMAEQLCIDACADRHLFGCGQ